MRCAKGIIILGPSGSGKTTLGKLTATELGLAFIDIDEYIWRDDTEISYTVMYSKEEKIQRLMRAVQAAGKFIMAGSMSSFHQHFDPMFVLAVYLTASSEIRAERVHVRELKEFGNRILPGGDMFESHQIFLEGVKKYDNGSESCNSEQHELWLNQLMCPVLQLDGEESLKINAGIIAEEYRKIEEEE